MNSRVAVTFAIALMVLAYFWLNLGEPPTPPVPATTPEAPAGAPDTPPSDSEASPAAPGPRSAPSAAQPAAPAPASGSEAGHQPLAPAASEAAGDDDDSAGGFELRRPYPVDRDGIQAAMTSQIDSIRQCYDAWIQKNPDIEGKLVLGFTIEPDGEAPEEASVRGVEIKDGSTVDHVFLEGCVVSAVDELRFEAPRDGGVMTVNYPFMFSNE